MASVETKPKKRRSSVDEPPNVSTEDKSLRIITFGNSEDYQFSLTKLILKNAFFDSDDPNATLTTKNSESISGRNVTVVNTPNLKNHDLMHFTFKKELKKSVCFSCPGPHVVLFTLGPSDMKSDAYNIFKPVVQYFGEKILNHTVVVLYHELQGDNYRELIEKCHQRYLIVNENTDIAEMTNKLFDIIDQIIVNHGVFSNVEFKEADNRIEKEMKILEKAREKEVRRMLEELKKQGEDAVKRYKEEEWLKTRKRAEVLVADRIGFTHRLVDYAAAIGKGAAAGALFGLAMGIQAMEVGAVVGAGLGALLGGAAGAAWNVLVNTFTGVHRDS
ncbi:GTPase IMAP family member 9 [Trichomycterus rosablanca]|uniref:GTPase IMAP family member 9 n=1 Tax=Trichomycterus rosablanca TaxID=2290929 RepID=UPI002F351D72